jgi:hypothetical protein
VYSPSLSFNHDLFAYSTLTAAEFSPHETLSSKKTPFFHNSPSMFQTSEPNSKFSALTTYPSFQHHLPTFLLFNLNLNRHPQNLQRNHFTHFHLLRSLPTTQIQKTTMMMSVDGPVIR